MFRRLTRSARTATAGCISGPASGSQGGTVGRNSARARIRRESTKPARQNEPCSPGEIPELDRLIHERMRLGIISALAVNDSLSFSDLKRLLHTTDGNLSVHARKLEEGGYITCRKFFEGRIPRTEYRVTAHGRRALEEYLRDMEEVIRINRRA
jgi:DNA-binding HxlR family transcriptional regulator